MTELEALYGLFFDFLHKRQKDCGKDRHNRAVIHRKDARQRVIPNATTPGAGPNTQGFKMAKPLNQEKKKLLSTENDKTYYDYYVFIEILINNKP